MTPQIHLLSENSFIPMKDTKLKSLSAGSHGWQETGATWIFGVVHAKEGVHPLDVVDHMKSLGLIVLPSMNDSTTPIDPKVYATLAKYIAPTDRTREIATKMGKMHPLLRPSDY